MFIRSMVPEIQLFFLLGMRPQMCTRGVSPVPLIQNMATSSTYDQLIAHAYLYTGRVCIQHFLPNPCTEQLYLKFVCFVYSLFLCTTDEGCCAAAEKCMVYMCPPPL